MKSSINNKILSLIEQSPSSTKERIAQRVKARRLDLNLTQSALASRAGIPLPTYRHFESTANVSLDNLLKIAMVLDALGDFEHLFEKRRHQSIDELLQQKNQPARKRGSRSE